MESLQSFHELESKKLSPVYNLACTHGRPSEGLTPEVAVGGRMRMMRGWNVSAKILWKEIGRFSSFSVTFRQDCVCFTLNEGLSSFGVSGLPLLV